MFKRLLYLNFGLLFCHFFALGCSEESHDSSIHSSFNDSFQLQNEVQLNVDALGADIQYEEHERGFLLMDAEDEKILLFSDDGDLVKTIGGRGRGPGEFMNLVAFAVGDGLIYAYDGPLWRLSMFDASTGEFVKSLHLDEVLRIHDMEYADGLLYTFTGFTFQGLPNHVSVIDPQDGKVINSFMEPSQVIEELDFPLSGALRSIDSTEDKIVITHPLELRTAIYDLEGSLTNEIYGESVLYEEPNTDYQMMAPLHTAVSALVVSSRAVSDKFFIELRRETPDEARDLFLEIYDYEGKRLNNSPIQFKRELELIYISQNEEFIFLERISNNQNPKLILFKLNKNTITS